MVYSSFDLRLTADLEYLQLSQLQVQGRKKLSFRFSVTERALVSYEERVAVSSME